MESATETTPADPFNPAETGALAAMTPAEIELGRAVRALYLEVPAAVGDGVKAIAGAVLAEARALRRQPIAVPLQIVNRAALEEDARAQSPAGDSLYSGSFAPSIVARAPQGPLTVEGVEIPAGSTAACEVKDGNWQTTVRPSEDVVTDVLTAADGPTGPARRAAVRAVLQRMTPRAPALVVDLGPSIAEEATTVLRGIADVARLARGKLHRHDGGVAQTFGGLALALDQTIAWLADYAPAVSAVKAGRRCPTYALDRVSLRVHGVDAAPANRGVLPADLDDGSSMIVDSIAGGADSTDGQPNRVTIRISRPGEDDLVVRYIRELAARAHREDARRFQTALQTTARWLGHPDGKLEGTELISAVLGLLHARKRDRDAAATPFDATSLTADLVASGELRYPVAFGSKGHKALIRFVDEPGREKLCMELRAEPDLTTRIDVIRRDGALLVDESALVAVLCHAFAIGVARP